MDNPRHTAVRFLVIAALLLNAGMGAAMPLAEHLFGDHDHTFSVERHNDHLHYIFHHDEHQSSGVTYSSGEDEHPGTHVLHSSTDNATTVRTLKVHVPSVFTFLYSQIGGSISLPPVDHALYTKPPNGSPPTILQVKHTVLLI